MMLFVRLARGYAGSRNVHTKTGILMVNMGGPRTPEEVQPFLTRLFLDRDIMQLPMQNVLGPLIAKRRSPSIRKKYEEIGGGSPILKWTKKQGDLMCKLLDEKSPSSAPHTAFVGFRYAYPLTEDTLEELESSGIERVIVFSQYPQYSCSTSGSSLNAIARFYSKKKSNIKWSVIDRWPLHPLLIKTHAELIRKELAKLEESAAQSTVLLFSAHSLPQRVVDKGDPYAAEVGATVTAVMQELGWSHPYRLVWQSKVGPVSWLAPSTEGAITALAKRGRKNLLLVPIAFVNDHIETLHELDIEYADEVARKVDAKVRRVPCLNDHPLFIQCLADVVMKHMQSSHRLSPHLLLRCPHCTNPDCAKMRAWFNSHQQI